MTGAAIIVAAGSSERLGTGQKKEYMNIAGKPVLQYSCEAFAECEEISYIYIVVPPAGIPFARELIQPAISAAQKEDILVDFVEGGTSRQQSVYNGLRALERAAPDYVLIHDGARPWISKECIRKVLEQTAEHGACAPAVVPADAMKRIGPDGSILEHLSRDTTLGIQTPQGFGFPDILKAHGQAAADGRKYIDDTEIYCRYIHPVYTVPGEAGNRKITYLHDFEVPK